MIFKIKKFINLVISVFFKIYPFKSYLLNTYSAYTIEEKLNLRTPYTNLKLIKFLTNYAKENSDLNVFEYGSGSSTLFFEDHFSNVYSVEHDDTWFHTITKYVKNAKVFYVPPVKKKNPLVKSQKKGFKNLDFSDYVNSIKNFELYFDIIFIDGRARVDCLKIARNYLKPNGIIIIDDSSRFRYKIVISKLFPNNKVTHFRGFGTFIPLLHKASIIN